MLPALRALPLVAVLAAAPPAWAAAPAGGLAPAADAGAPEAQAEPASRAPFRGPEYRWPHRSVIPRTLVDLVAVPASVVDWDAGDWGRFAVFGGSVLLLMAPTDPSPDVRLDRWLTDHADPHVPVVWTRTMQFVMWGSLATAGFGTWAWAALADRPDIAQAMSLSGEALAVSQFWHVVPKLLLGRDGPQNGDGRGLIRGPANALEVYPAGTPSGHAGTLYVLLSVNLAYFRPPTWVHVVAHAVVGGVVAMHVVNHRHFVSDSLWGAATGWFIGQWVVAHRAGPRPFGPEGAPGGAAADAGPELHLVPAALPGGGAGLALMGRW